MSSDAIPMFGEIARPQRAGRTPYWGYSDLLLVIAGILASIAASVFLAGIAMAIAPALKKDANKPALSLAFEVVLYLLVYLSLHLTLASRYGLPVLKSLGWKWPRLSMTIPLVGGLLLPFAISLLIAPFHPPKIDSPFDKFAGSQGTLVAFAVLATVLAPVMEELVFRGFLQPLLTRDLGVVAGILIASLLFGALHAPEYSYTWQLAAAVALAGVAFGAVRVWLDSTLASALMHGCFNLVMVIALFAKQAAKH